VPLPTLTEPEEAQDFVDARIAEGSDYIKIVYDNRSQKTGEPEPTLRKETMAALIEAAHRRGKRTVVHVVKLQDARDAIEMSADGLAHVFVDQLPDASFASFAAESQIFLIPTLAIQEYVCGVTDGTALTTHPAVAPYLSAADTAQLQSSSYHFTFGDYRVAEEAVRQLKAVGVPILAGTDAPILSTESVSIVS
jgi:imidazolonepropionase-like amidohydrolase